MSSYNIIAASNESTVVAEYVPESTRSECPGVEPSLGMGKQREFFLMGDLLQKLVQFRGNITRRTRQCRYAAFAVSGALVQ